MNKPNRRALLAAAFVLVLGAGALAQGLAQRLQNKAAAAQTRVREWIERGRDASAVVAVLQQVKPALDAGDAGKAEALLDRALSMLGVHTPPGDHEEPPSDLYIRPAPVSIVGYEGSAMEPFPSMDGRYLFFNNENDPRVDTNLHFAVRVGKHRFRYLGELPGANSSYLDAAPSLDRSGRLFFTSLRTYRNNMQSVYCADFHGGSVSNVRPLPGAIGPSAPGTVNMDVSISPDGQTLYISQALFAPGSSVPRESVLTMARWRDGGYQLDPESSHILGSLRSTALQYAPSISVDGLELYFTRASQLMAGSTSSGAGLRIVVTSRTSTQEPFGEPRRLSALTGFVEAPAVSLDGKEMFFHKKEGMRFLIYRAERNSK